MPQSYQLVMRSGPTPGKSYELNKNEIYIGRDISNDIVINDSEISRKHARLVLQDSGYILEDLGSTNGTFVGGQRLMGPYTLRPGDLILFGENVSLTYGTAVFDPDATQVATSRPASAVPSPFTQPEIPQPSPYRPATPPPSYSGQIPPGPAPVETYEAPEQKTSGARNWLLAGCGCLVMLLICGAISLFLVDQYNLWCTLFGFFFRYFNRCM